MNSIESCPGFSYVALLFHKIPNSISFIVLLLVYASHLDEVILRLVVVRGETR
jgi:hypothetical protein